MYDNSNNVELTLKKKLFQVLMGIIFFLLAIFISFSSITFDFNETGWLVVSSEETKNFFGVLGSYISGFLFKEFGILTPIFLSLIFVLYGFKYLKHQTIKKFAFKFCLILGLILLLGILSQPLHKMLSIYFKKSEILTYQGFCADTYKFILEKVQNLFSFGITSSSILTNIIITLLCTLIFIYTSSTNIAELRILNKLIAPFYLPFYWTIQLLNNLLVKKSYF